ncbi:MAG: NAD-dependent epimerase/dehydratase family protein [Parachlamydiaceae bacterium]|nr:NAD-dependent epimerase/dehydratase family protein [Parachlamydiaceae bacterium]
MNKRIFVTGAAGFIGFHLASFLQARGDTVLGIDNFNSYYNPELKFTRAKKLKNHGISILEADICEGEKLREIVEEFAPTHFVHLAAQAGVRYSLTHPGAYLKANIDGFLQVLEACRLSTGLKLIYASSSSVYGLNTKAPFSIHDNTDRQASLYGVTKKTNELMAQTYHHLYGIPVTGLRFFTVYGPWGRPDMAYYSFTKAILEGQPIEIYNDGKMMRDFTYIDDIVNGIAAAIDLGAKCELFNLGNNQPMQLMDLVSYLEMYLKKKAITKFLPMQAGDVLSTYADIDYSFEKLNFKPTTSLKEGIGKFVDWYRSEIG